MIQHTALQRNDLLSAKDRLRGAAREASIRKVIRQNPWASVLGVSAGTFAITGILGSFRFGGGRRSGGRNIGQNAGQAGPNVAPTGPGLIGTLLQFSGPLSNLAMKALEGYVMKKAVTGTEAAQPGENT